jgi:hypothetical protein
MEPVELFVGFILIFGGYELISNDKNESVSIEEVQKVSVVSDAPVFERGRFFKTIDGYYISNLTPARLKVEGCDRPILTADLTAPRVDNEEIQVTEVDMACEG